MTDVQKLAVLAVCGLYLLPMLIIWLKLFMDRGQGLKYDVESGYHARSIRQAVFASLIPGVNIVITLFIVTM